MRADRDPFTLRLCLRMIQIAAHLVPRRTRADWRLEWESELRHRFETRSAQGRIDWSEAMDLLRRSLGAWLDAAWIRRQFTSDAELLHDARHAVRLLFASP